MKHDVTEVFDALDILLDDERTALMKGDLDAIPGILARKEALFDALPELDERSEEKLSGLKEKTLRNQALLDSAMMGIRAVADRMNALRRVRDRLETYDEQGNRQAVTAVSGQHIEKRA